jgi:hypothetical protein
MLWYIIRIIEWNKKRVCIYNLTKVIIKIRSTYINKRINPYMISVQNLSFVHLLWCDTIYNWFCPYCFSMYRSNMDLNHFQIIDMCAIDGLLLSRGSRRGRWRVQVCLSRGPSASGCSRLWLRRCIRVYGGCFSGIYSQQVRCRGDLIGPINMSPSLVGQFNRGSISARHSFMVDMVVD